MTDTPQPTIIDIGPMQMTVPCEKLFGALARAQAKFGPLKKSNTAKIPGKEGRIGYEYDYADLADTIDTCRPHLSAEGLAVIQAPVTTGRGVEVSTMVTHESGQWLLIKPLHMPAGNSPQALGSAITYARRYQYQPALGLAAEDDDGGEAQRNPPPKQAPARQQRKPAATRADGPADEPLCSGGAAPLAKENDKLAGELTDLLGTKKSTVWRSVCNKLDIEPKPPAQLTVKAGVLIKHALAAKLAAEKAKSGGREPGEDPPEDDDDQRDPTDQEAP